MSGIYLKFCVVKGCSVSLVLIINVCFYDGSLSDRGRGQNCSVTEVILLE